jgi:hypothetical protein
LTNEQLKVATEQLEKNNETIQVNQDFIDQVNKKHKKQILRTKLMWVGIGLAVGFVAGGVVLGVTAHYVGR